MPTNELLPSNISFGTAEWHFGSAPLMPGDADGYPDFAPGVGVTVTFTASTAAVVDSSAAGGPVTIEMVPIVCGLDSQGWLVGGDGQRGVKLIATDDPDLNPTGFTYHVTFLRNGQKVAALRDFDMDLPTLSTKNLSIAMPVPSSTGVSLNQAQAAEAAAVAAASAASAAAAAAAASAATFVPATVDTLGQATTVGKALAKAASQAAAQVAIDAASTATVAAKVDKGVLVFNAKDNGVVGNRLAVYTGAMTSGSATLTISTSGVSFTSADVGKAVTVAGAGAAGATLRAAVAAYVSATQVTLTDSAGTTVSGKYTVWGTDDTAAIQAALAAMTTTSSNPMRGGELLIPKGARCMITGTVNVQRVTGGIKGAGFCDWNAGFNAASMGSMLFWDGPAGSPMFQMQGVKFFRFENLSFIGNPTADSRPSALLRFNQPDSATTNGQITVENCNIGRYGAYGGFTGGNTERVATAGILVDGVNVNNDRFRILGGRIEGCVTGLSLPNSQSVLGISTGTTFAENDTHIATAAQIEFQSVYLSRSAVRDLDISSSARVSLNNVGSEFSGQLARMRGQSKLIVNGGYFTLTDSLTGPVIDAVDNTRQTIRLKDLSLLESTGWVPATAPTLVSSHATTNSSLSNKMIELDNIQYPNATNIGVTPSWFDVTPVGTLESVTVYGNVQPAGAGNQNHGVQQFFFNLLRAPTDTLNFTRDDRQAAVTRTLQSDLPTGAKGQTFERRSGTTSAAGTSGRLVMAVIYLYAGDVISSITFGSGATALAGGTHGWAALFTSARVPLAQSVDDTAITWAAGAEKTFSLASSVTIPTSGWYYVGYNIVATTMPTVISLANSIITSKALAVGGNSTTGLTDTAPNPAGTIAPAPYPYACVQ